MAIARSMDVLQRNCRRIFPHGTPLIFPWLIIKLTYKRALMRQALLWPLAFYCALMHSE
jgi:hypothetical protein